MSHYEIVKMDEGTYRIQDSLNDSMYLLVGKTKALCIDCGMDKEPLMPVIQSITDLPVELMITHGHLDHAGASNEFEKVYMDNNEHDFYANTIETVQHLNFKPLENIIWLDSDIYDLDGRKLYIVPLYGHTPGSIIIVDPLYQHVYTGDAIGSGCGVWMQVPFALPLDDYLSHLKNAYDKLIYLGVDESWHFEGGHYGQEYLSKVSEYNRLDLALLKDMINLNKLLLQDQLNYVPSDQKEFNEKPYYAAFYKAEMIFTLSQKECTRINLTYAKNAMDRYLSNFDQDDPKIKLKLVHTYEVMHTSAYICKKEGFNHEQTRLALLIALLHDIGRFEQVKRYQCFEDSIIDHAKLGVEILFEQGLIQSFIQDRTYDDAIKVAIANHSLYAIDPQIQPDYLMQAQLIRDSDKLDNYRVKMIEQITTLFDISEEAFLKEKVGDKVLQAVRNHELILKEIRVNHMDRWVSYLAFLFDLNFKSSYWFIKENDYINRNIDRFTYLDQVTIEEIRSIMNHYLEDKINANY